MEQVIAVRLKVDKAHIPESKNKGLVSWDNEWPDYQNIKLGHLSEAKGWANEWRERIKVD